MKRFKVLETVLMVVSVILATVQAVQGKETTDRNPFDNF